MAINIGFPDLYIDTILYSYTANVSNNNEPGTATSTERQNTLSHGKLNWKNQTESTEAAANQNCKTKKTKQTETEIFVYKKNDRHAAGKGWMKQFCGIFLSIFHDSEDSCWIRCRTKFELWRKKHCMSRKKLFSWNG